MTEPAVPQDPRPDYEVKVIGKQDGNNISYEMKVYADDPVHAFEQGIEWAQHHTDDWKKVTIYLNPITYWN